MKDNLARVMPTESPVEHHASTALAYEISSTLTDAKGIDPLVLDVSKVFSLSDYFIVVSGRSDRQVQGLAMKALDSAKKLGVLPVVVEGIDQGHWALIDFGEVVVHIFYEPLREKYDIEGLWANAEQVTLKKPKKKKK